MNSGQKKQAIKKRKSKNKKRSVKVKRSQLKANKTDHNSTIKSKLSSKKVFSANSMFEGFRGGGAWQLPSIQEYDDFKSKGPSPKEIDPEIENRLQRTDTQMKFSNIRKTIK